MITRLIVLLRKTRFHHLAGIILLAFVGVDVLINKVPIGDWYSTLFLVFLIVLFGERR